MGADDLEEEAFCGCEGLRVVKMGIGDVGKGDGGVFGGGWGVRDRGLKGRGGEEELEGAAVCHC